MTINVRYYLETWVVLHFILQAELRNILILTTVSNKNVKGGRVISVVPHMEHNFCHLLFCVTLSTCGYERIPKWFEVTFSHNAITNREKSGSTPIQQTFLKYGIQLM